MPSSPWCSIQMCPFNALIPAIIYPLLYRYTKPLNGVQSFRICKETPLHSHHSKLCRELWSLLDPGATYAFASARKAPQNRPQQNSSTIRFISAYRRAHQVLSQRHSQCCDKFTSAQQNFYKAPAPLQTAPFFATIQRLAPSSRPVDPPTLPPHSLTLVHLRLQAQQAHPLGLHHIEQMLHILLLITITIHVPQRHNLILL